jgi:heme a synthase
MTSLNNFINDRSFRRLALLTVILVYLLILVGGIVRSTGSGMGCPDWPRCFGQWIPPTNVSELPTNYQEVYSHRGYANTEFNAVKTWIEYLNRLIGVLIGFFIFLTFIAATVAYWRRDRAIVGYSFLAFVLVGVQGWLGAKVVFSVLSVWLITLHMLLAIVIVSILMYVVARSQASKPALMMNLPARAKLWLFVSSALLLVQILLGTQVREMVDEVANQFGEQQRFRWVDALGIRFYIHRSFSLVVLGTQLAWVWPTLKTAESGLLRRFACSLLALIGFEIFSGTIMAYFAIPGWAQPVHLTLAVLTWGIQFLIILFANKETFLSNVILSVNRYEQV